MDTMSPTAATRKQIEATIDVLRQELKLHEMALEVLDGTNGAAPRRGRPPTVGNGRRKAKTASNGRKTTTHRSPGQRPGGARRVREVTSA